jgi:hypothetical protein
MPPQPGPPSPDPCLVHSRRTRYRGGTLIASEVHDLPEHERRLRAPDIYRPDSCPRCGHNRLHVHDRPQRILVGDSLTLRTTILRFICAAATCGATWRILPAFIARHLWRSWSTVSRTIYGDPPGRPRVRVPATTRRRWSDRLGSAGAQLVHLLARHGDAQVVLYASGARDDFTRLDVIEFFTATRALGKNALEDIAATAHALEPGIRLM